MAKYISISRKFAPVEKTEFRNPDYLTFFESVPGGVYKWPDLLNMAPLVILGEGRPGKTREFEKQVDVLRASGGDAFFIPLERLHDEDLKSAMHPKDVEAFERWKQSPTVMSRMWWKLPGGELRACEIGSVQPARSSAIGSMG